MKNMNSLRNSVSTDWNSVPRVLSKKGGASYLVDYRYSTLKIFHAAGIDLGTGSAQPDYQDITFNLNVPTKKGKLTLFGIAGKSYAEIIDAETDSTEENIYDNNMRQNGQFGTNMGVVGLQQIMILNDNSYAKLTLSASTSGQNYKVDSIGTFDNSVNPWYRNNSNQQKYALNFIYNKKLSTRNYIRTGLITDYIVFLYTDSVLRNQTAFQTITKSDGSSLLAQAFAQWQHKFSDKISISPGLHSQYYALNNTYTVEPRIGFKMELQKNQSIGFGTGLYSQLQPMYAYFQETTLAGNELKQTNHDMEMTTSAHFVFAYDKVFVKDLRLKVETYFQYLFNVPVEQQPSTFSILNDGAILY